MKIDAETEDPEIIAQLIDGAYEATAPTTEATAHGLGGSDLASVRDDADRDLLSMATKGETSRQYRRKARRASAPIASVLAS